MLIFEKLKLNKNEKIFVAGHNGMVGSAIFRALKKLGFNNLICINKSELDLTNQEKVNSFIKSEKPQQIYLAAAKVGGIYANDVYPAEFIYANLMIQTNIINAARINGVKKLLFLGSNCIYPKFSPQPMKEEVLLSGTLEPTNEPYAIAKIAGIKMCESYNRQYGTTEGIDYRSIMPTNLYGPGDNYHPLNSHVVPALISRFHEAKVNRATNVTIWGSGKVKREFLYVDDMAEASIYFMNINKNNYKNLTKPMLSHINIGYGIDMTIEKLAYLIKEVVGFDGNILFDKTKPDGAPRKLMDCNLSSTMGWKPKVKLSDGLKLAYSDFLLKIDEIRR